MYEALLALVAVHAQISSVAKPLLERALVALLLELAKVALECFKLIKKFGMGGMLSVSLSFIPLEMFARPLTFRFDYLSLQATLEIEFMHQTLMAYVTPTATTVLTDIYSTISKAYARPSGSGSGDELQRELEGVKKTLYDSRKATQVEYICFRATKKSSSSSSSRKSDPDKPRKDSGKERERRAAVAVV